MFVKFNNKKGFTLAEVLITLSIIGVIAALTIPTLILDSNKAETAARLKKFYSTMSNAISLAEHDTRTYTTQWSGPEVASRDRYYEKYLKKYLKGRFEKTSPIGSTYSSFYFDDGTVMHFTSTNMDAVYIYDVNGDAKPNKYGVDRFHFTTCFNNNPRACDAARAGTPFDTYLNCTNCSTREDYLKACSEWPEGTEDLLDENPNIVNCAALIKFDGWQIKDDYPYL